MDAILKYWPVAVLIFQALFFWGMWSMRHAFASKADLALYAKSNDERVAALEKEQSLHDERLRNVPTSDDLNQVSIKLAELHGDHKALTAEIGGVKSAIETIDKSVTRIESWLMNPGSRP